MLSPPGGAFKYRTGMKIAPFSANN